MQRYNTIQHNYATGVQIALSLIRPSSSHFILKLVNRRKICACLRRERVRWSGGVAARFFSTFVIEESWWSALPLLKESAIPLRRRIFGGPGSSVSITTDYGLDGPGSNPGGDEIFRPFRPALGPTRRPVQWVSGLSRG